MPYARITGTRNGAAAIRYALGGEGENEKGHNDNEFRNEYIMPVNMLPGEAEPYDRQMDRHWRMASARNKVQVRRIIISFSRNELDPDNPESIMRAAQICGEFTKENYPGRQALVCIQTDGKSGLVHGHILVNNVSFDAGTVKDALVRDHKNDEGKWVYATRDVNVPAGRGCLDCQTNHNFVEQRARAIAERYIDIDPGKENRERLTQAERAKRAAGEYVYKDDLRNRIRAARDEATSYDNFLELLPAHGIKLNRQGSSKKHGDYLTYEQTDLAIFDPASTEYDPDAKKPKSFQCRSYGLGDEFCPDAIKQHIHARFPQQIHEAEQQPVTRGSTITPPSYSPVQPDDGFPDFAAWAADVYGYEYDQDTFVDFYDQHKIAYQTAKAAAARPTQEQQPPQTQDATGQIAPPTMAGARLDHGADEDERRAKASERRARMEQQRDELERAAAADREAVREESHKQQTPDAILEALERSAAIRNLDRDSVDKQFS